MFWPLALGVLVGNTLIHGFLGDWKKGFEIGIIAALLVLACGVFL